MGSQTHCLCNHLTFFGSTFLVMPNAIDVRQTRELFGTFENNPVIVTTVDCLFVAHMLVVIWARRKDAQNQAKVRLYGPGEWEGEAGVNPCRSSREWSPDGEPRG